MQDSLALALGSQCGPSATWSDRPSRRVQGVLLVSEGTRRAGLRCADVEYGGVVDRGAPKRRAPKHNAVGHYAQR